MRHKGLNLKSLPYTRLEGHITSIKCQKFDLENEGECHQQEKRDFCHSIRFYSDFFQNCSYSKVYVYSKGKLVTHSVTDTRTARDLGPTIGK